MKRDEGYFAREDIAFSAWLDARRTRLETESSNYEMLNSLLRSAFLSGVRFGVIESETEGEELIEPPCEHGVRSREKCGHCRLADQTRALRIKEGW